MPSNYGSITGTPQLTRESRVGVPAPLSTSPSLPSVPLCSRTPRRHLVMPSLRSLVSSTTSPSTGGSRTPSTPVPTTQHRAMGASTSQSESSPPDSEQQSLSGRLVAPRPSLLPMSPKRPMKRDASCGSLLMGLRPNLQSRSGTNIRKCETQIALSSMEPLKPVNRLRMGSSRGLMCSRCSSVLSMQASRASLNTVLEVSGVQQQQQQPMLLCKLCLSEVPMSATTTIQQCQCTYCTDCIRQYITLEVTEAAYEISCPDAQCEKQGVLSLPEIEALITPELMEKHRKFRLNTEVDRDSGRVWCPRAGCETVCRVCPGCLPQAVHCPTCADNFCSNCKQPWHPNQPCPEDKGSNKLVFDPERIKRCPWCAVPIEKDEGCAQMMCKRCKHVFCWYCLASLDDDFLLRHYDKGPCKNKLGHSRASVIWHRTQVIAIFAGFGVLLLVASPLLLLAAPCIVCCKCRTCQDKQGDNEASTPDLETPASQRNT